MKDPRELREPGLGLGRDPERTPMPWDTSANAGFTTGAPWLPLNADWTARNVARQAQAPGSMLALYKGLLALRRAHPALSVGEIMLLDDLDALDDLESLDGQQGAPDVLAYERRHGDDRLLVALNLGSTRQELALPAWARDLRPLLSTIDAPSLARGADRIVLRPDEGLVLGRASAP